MKKLSAKNKLKNFYGPDFTTVDDFIKNYVDTLQERQFLNLLQNKLCEVASKTKTVAKRKNDPSAIPALIESFRIKDRELKKQLKQNEKKLCKKTLKPTKGAEKWKTLSK